LNRGEKTVEILKQLQFEPMPLEKQVMIIYVATHGYLDDVKLELVKPFEVEFHKFMESQYPDVGHLISQTKNLDEATEKKLNEAIKRFKQEFLK
jgi:F-type H+-transporting ATPase subunit alpha